mmetsp:Transcript_16698/g.38546  ORF Transcript_16698/g.38546 Transcript_16698/m.38546 type:complete len:263 (-) Transcript_16698:260-1048(-)|eukprot:CAMPEP_0197175306 /NCGR_PEP_ID=MMETSP1423-20130617/1567_1 /TAXON_ID=476441 /ORGANISM="Pseudo-nitzschia heimii, Strain UNC1101" /LENGTH=262 /DNA_ID=CAMNT_0042624429 /DNA_START=269 /DNA_END=1057 /DNA_ORIENTATION=-
MKRMLLGNCPILCGALCLLLGNSPTTSFSFGLVPKNAGHNAATRKASAAPTGTTPGRTEQPGASNPLVHAASMALVAITLVGFQPPALADEFGREIEMPFLDAGETVQICIKRGPLGKCEQTERRTVENENDKSEKYFHQPTVVAKSDSIIPSADSEGNLLIERLKQRSEENAEKNNQLVYMRTLQNDSSASFGPFDGQVLIMNEDGKGFTLLKNPQAMRLKKAGFIENKKFVKQPTQDEIVAALESDQPGIFGKIFGGGGD